MTAGGEPAPSSPKKRRGTGPALCSLLGTLILIGVIAAFLPLTLPKLLGYQVYEVVSGSMEPEIPVGSAIFVKEKEPKDIEEGDIIAFVRRDSVVTHRVEKNQYVEGTFITKGDANSREDAVPVNYESLIGRVEWHLPVIGIVMSLLASTVGKLYAGILAACGLMFYMLAGSMKKRQKE